MEIQREHGKTRLGLARLITATGDVWIFDKRNKRKWFENLQLLESCDDEGNYNFKGEQGRVIEIHYGKGYYPQYFTFKEFVQIGRPTEIERTRVSFYRLILKESKQ